MSADQDSGRNCTSAPTLKVEVLPLPAGHEWLWIVPPSGPAILLLSPGSTALEAAVKAYGDRPAIGAGSVNAPSPRSIGAPS